MTASINLDKFISVLGRGPGISGEEDPSRVLDFQPELVEVWGCGDLGTKMLMEYLG